MSNENKIRDRLAFSQGNTLIEIHIKDNSVEFFITKNGITNDIELFNDPVYTLINYLTKRNGKK